MAPLAAFLAPLALLRPPARAFGPARAVAPPLRLRGRAVALGSLPTSAAASADAAAVPRVEDDAAHSREKCEVLLLDHLNINHERGRQDAARAFYFNFLGCSVDPRKYDNYLAGKGTVWANAGMHQFHLPEGRPDAQTFDGMITLLHSDLDRLMSRYNEYLDGDEKFTPLKETEFLVGRVKGMMLVTDPWGSQFCILPSDNPNEDRAAHIGAQPSIEGHRRSEALAMEDLTVYIPHGANLEGIGRFYEHVLGAHEIEELWSGQSISVAMGERQTLTFQYHPDGPSARVEHHDFGRVREDGDGGGDGDGSPPVYPPNHGPHLSLYVTKLSDAYRMAEGLGVLYVNPRFKRRAYTEEEALDQCMFRMIDVVDPLDEEREVILRLEHEVRSATTRDGRKYGSCPLLDVSA